MASQRFAINELDGHTLTLGEIKWRLEVLGVVEHDNRRWIQLDADGPIRVHLLVNAALSASPADILLGMQRFLIGEHRYDGSVLVID